MVAETDADRLPDVGGKVKLMVAQVCIGRGDARIGVEPPQRNPGAAVDRNFDEAVVVEVVVVAAVESEPSGCGAARNGHGLAERQGCIDEDARVAAP